MTDKTLLGGRYELDQVIGRGGMAEVWRARDLRLQRDVAVKRLRVDLASDSTFQERFRREAHAAGGLNHPNIVAVYDTGEEKDPHSDVAVPYIVMELVEGVTLRDVLRDGRKVVAERALDFTAGVLDALAYSHRAGIIHRDIKPANVMLTPTGSVKVMDFGIARAVADTSATMTQTAAVIGTAQYLSPEQARGEKVDNRSDLYSVGCLLYELLTSQPPFKGDSPVSVAYQHVRENPVPPSQVDPEVTPGMDAVVLKALAKDPSDRYQDAREFRDDVLRAMHNQPVHARPPVASDTGAPTALIAPVSAPETTTTLPNTRYQATPMRAMSPTEQDRLEAEEDQSGKSKLPVIIGVLSLLVIAAVIAAAWLVMNNRTPKVETVPVPRVIGSEKNVAYNTLINGGFDVKITEVTDKEDTKGLVIKQDPVEKTMVPKGSTITITISTGVDKLTIPQDLLNKPVDEARRLLESAGFQPGQIAVEDADPKTEPKDAKEGHVVGIDPGPGAKIDRDQTVKLTVATGQSIVPELKGKKEADAKKLGEEKGFIVTRGNLVESNRPEGEVLAQSAPAGQPLKRGETITIDIAVPPPSPTPEPSSVPEEPPARPSHGPSEPKPPTPSSTDGDGDN